MADPSEASKATRAGQRVAGRFVLSGVDELGTHPTPHRTARVAENHRGHVAFGRG